MYLLHRGCVYLHASRIVPSALVRQERRYIIRIFIRFCFGEVDGLTLISFHVSFSASVDMPDPGFLLALLNYPT